MKKILLIVMLLALVAVPAFAGGSFGLYKQTYAVSATSQAGVSSESGTFGFGVSGTATSAWNTSSAVVKFNQDPAVYTGATTNGGTLTVGFNGNTWAGQSGSAFATGTQTGFKIGGFGGYCF